MDISSKKGRNKLQAHKHQHVTRTLKLLNKLWQMANADNASFQQVKDATQAHIDIFQYILPKLQAVAVGELDKEGNINPKMVLDLADKVEEQLKIKEQSLKLLDSQQTNADTCDIVIDGLIRPVDDAAFSQESGEQKSAD